MKLDVLTLEQCQQVRGWRNDCLESLRTTRPLTELEQESFYREIVANRNSSHRYWAIYIELTPKGSVIKEEFIGMGGITGIQWENRIGEISLILDPEQRGKGYGEKAVDLLLEQAFDYLNLKTVIGECYGCNENRISFWLSITTKYNGFSTVIPDRKFWNGEYHDSLYFSISNRCGLTKSSRNKDESPQALSGAGKTAPDKS